MGGTRSREASPGSLVESRPEASMLNSTESGLHGTVCRLGGQKLARDVTSRSGLTLHWLNLKYELPHTHTVKGGYI